MSKQCVSVVNIFCLSVLLLLSNISYADKKNNDTGMSEEEKTLVADKARVWLENLDQGNYSQAWENLSPSLKLYAAKDAWMQMLYIKRHTKGKFKSRIIQHIKRVDSMSYSFDDVDYFVKFDSSFEGGIVTEQVTYEIQEDGSLAISGYYIVGKSDPKRPTRFKLKQPSP